MKTRVILISLAVLVGSLAVVLGLKWSKKDHDSSFNAAEWDSYSEKKLDEALASAFSVQHLPVDQEVEFLKWALSQYPEKTKSLIREKAVEISSLPEHMSMAAWEWIREENADLAIQTVAFARELFPNNPHVLGMAGVLNLFGGRPNEGRAFLEEAERWRQDNPIVNFYLGNLLVRSEGMSDRSRGKEMLLRVVQGPNQNLSELAGLGVLADQQIPLISEDIHLIYDSLNSQDVFRLENTALNIEALRSILNRMVPEMPDEALKLADLLLDFPAAKLSDHLGVIELAQSLQKTQFAAEKIAEISEDPLLESGSAEAKRYARIKALQLLAEEKYEEGMDAFKEIVEGQPNAPELRNTIDKALKYELPRDPKASILEDYLTLPIDKVEASLYALSSLMELKPLREQDWIEYAANRLFELDPVRVGQWLSARHAAATVIEILNTKPDPLDGDETVALIEARLSEKQPEEALEALRKGRSQIDPPLASYLQCRILVQQGKFEEASVYWAEAHMGALQGEHFPLLKSLGFLALDLNQEINALQTLFTAFTAGISFSREQTNQLMNLTLSYGTLPQSIMIADYLHQSYPENPYYINNLSYFKFLAKENVDENVEIMRDLVKEYSDINPFRLTLALGLVKAGRTNEASRLIQTTAIDWNETGTRGQMIYAVILAASNQRVLAEGLISNLNTDELIPEERALLEEY